MTVSSFAHSHISNHLTKLQITKHLIEIERGERSLDYFHWRASRSNRLLTEKFVDVELSCIA